MTTDQVVAALAAEGYSCDRIRTVIYSFSATSWRQGDDWNGTEIDTLRRQLGEPDTEPDLRFNTDAWAADLGYILSRSTGEKVALDRDQLHRIATDLLHRADDPWIPEATKARLNVHGQTPGLYDPDYSVERWADDLGEAIRRETNGQLELTRPELQVAANLLLHAHEDGWVPQAARLREQADWG